MIYNHVPTVPIAHCKVLFNEGVTEDLIVLTPKALNMKKFICESIFRCLGKAMKFIEMGEKLWFFAKTHYAEAKGALDKSEMLIYRLS